MARTPKSAQLQRELEQRIGKIASRQEARRYRKRWADKDHAVHTTRHQLQCHQLNSTGACNCTN